MKKDPRNFQRPLRKELYFTYLKGKSDDGHLQLGLPVVSHERLMLHMC